ncbi:MAG TPA: AAA family ATPase, partial [Solirubrobacteraceae bacterium]|nr:AAA family ATPase [Solirubrobacteraceae bacterium]
MLTPLPASLRLRAPLPFVGRAAELRALAAALEPADAPALVPVVVAGEAGAGKSRLVAEGVSAAAARGARVLHGGCDAVVGVPYGPWVEALAPLVRDDSHGVARALGSAAADLARVLPELRAAAPEPLDADPDTQRHRLHGAVADLLALAAATAPLVVVLEDLHWADGGSIALLRHLARARPAAPVALVVTLRHGPADAGDELADALADLRRRDGVVRLDLGGLSAGEVDDLLARLAGAGDRELAAGLHDLTGGNPFLLGELWRSLHERGDLAVVDGRVVLARPLAELESPAAVREVTGRRIARLDADAAALLEAAAVIGREVPVDLLAAVLGSDEAALAGPLASAVAAGVLVEAPPPALRLRFAHELVRRALADRLDGLRRATLHLRVAEALDDPAVAPSQERRSAALAHHFTAAAAVGGRARAAHHHIEAARAASLALAYAEAARHLQTALELGIAEPAKRGAAELELGLALNRAGEVRGAVAAFGAAAATARARGDAMLLAEAAIGLEDTCWRPGLADAGASALLREAAATLGERDDALVVRVRGALARALTVEGGDRAEAAVLGKQAIAGARRSGDARALGQALVRAYWAKGDASRGDVLAALTEARDLGAELGDVELRAEAMAWRTVTLAAAGRVAEAHA